MKTCKKHIQFRDDCIHCLLDRIARLESNLDGINAIASDANASLQEAGDLDLEQYRERVLKLKTLPTTMPETTAAGNREASTRETAPA